MRAAAWIAAVAAGLLAGAALAESGSSEPNLRTGAAALVADREDRALAGDLDAQAYLAVQYYWGRSAPRLPERSLLWAELAAQGGHPIGQHMLALHHAHGLVLPKRPEQAVVWFRRAADQGYVEAQYALGRALFDGYGGPAEPASALDWLRKAAGQGHALAMGMLGYMHDVGAGGLARDEAAAERWYLAAAEAGDPTARENAAVLYLRRAAAPPELRTRAIAWLTATAAKGSARAQRLLGAAHAEGYAVPVDRAAARKWLALAEAQGDAEARTRRERLDRRAAALVANAGFPAAVGESFEDCTRCPELTVIPAGSVVTGGAAAPERTPAAIPRPLAVGTFEVTVSEWQACVQAGGCRAVTDPPPGRRPIGGVSWHDAQAYVGWLSGWTGERYRLLTEAEWEYAARAGATTEYFWGDAMGTGDVNCDGCVPRWGGRQPAPVGSYRANRFGLREVLGNLEEWVEDCVVERRAGDPECPVRVLRGGSHLDPPTAVRAASRSAAPPDSRQAQIGLRVAREAGRVASGE